MEVTSSNFQTLLPFILKSVAECEFVAIDGVSRCIVVISSHVFVGIHRIASLSAAAIETH